jgi:hypothetical protein
MSIRIRLARTSTSTVGPTGLDFANYLFATGSPSVISSGFPGHPKILAICLTIRRQAKSDNAAIISPIIDSRSSRNCGRPCSDLGTSVFTIADLRSGPRLVGPHCDPSRLDCVLLLISVPRYASSSSSKRSCALTKQCHWS